MAAGSCCRCLAGCGRVTFVIINVPLILMGIALIALGAAVLANAPFLSPITNSLQTALDSLASSVSAGGITIDTSGINISGLLQSVAIAVLVIGIVLFLIALFGCLGGCCEITPLVLIYIIALSVILIAQIVLVACIYSAPAPFDSTVKSALRSGLESDYQGIEGTNTVSLGWNAVMQSVGCCGLDDYTDFNSATNWPTSLTYSGVTVNLEMPVACCSTIDSTLTCTQVSSSNNYKSTGCYNKTWNLVLDVCRWPAVIVGVALALALQTFFIILGIIVIYVKSQKNKVGNKA